MIVMRSSGVSIGELVKATARAGIVIAIFGIVLGEYMSPPLDRYARQLKAFSKSGEVDIAGGQSAWVRDGRTIFNVSRASERNRFGGVYVFVMGEDGGLAAIGRASSAELTEENEWMLNNFAETVFTADGVTTRRLARTSQQNNLTPDLLALTEVRASSLDAIELYRYIQYLRNNGLNASRYQIAFWARLSMAAGIVVMCVLALPFVLGDLRSTGGGARMLIGVVIGLAYFLLSKTMADSGEVYNLNPFLVAWLPTILLAGATIIALGRTR
jgi:lipopolysaccharide export system permease protein